jgi:serine/threonine-protein kinase RsbW
MPVTSPPQSYEETVVIRSDTAEAQRVQELILGCAQERGFSEHEIFAIRLGTEEALVNAIKHGNGSDPTKKISIYYLVTTGEVRVAVEDEGPGFDPRTVPDPTTPDFLERPSGRGLMLMKCYMDEVTYNARGNRVEVRKFRAPPDP